VCVGPERLERWLAGFGERHGQVKVAATAELVTLTAADGALAQVEVPFPPLAERADPLDSLVAHVGQERVVGVLLVRRGGFAAGIFHGPRLTSSKVGSRHVQGRTAAGGWSQQRFARRREGQADVASAAAADVAARILLAEPLQALVGGGDRASVDAVLADSRLARLRPLVSGRLLDVPDPRLKVLQECRFRDVWIRVVDPEPAQPS
jgi:hypothetical protein